ncbi:hypothetical protein [Mucisphaera calidilacus]|uniref:Uncharacterized protein n=1 Tax=Mucisphaera calidilacus TaxID=2527982 RepID=A0A518BZ64_9BACT|nr:hypothetical protein [Mucisphaera calidilacus]QDU72259.1 hypothetical protein Pan265_21230 [Mucisphaera calidilacus]
MRSRFLKHVFVSVLLLAAAAAVHGQLDDEFAYAQREDFERVYTITTNEGATVSLLAAREQVRIEVPVGAEATVVHGGVDRRAPGATLAISTVLTRGTGAFTPIRIGVQGSDVPERRVYLQLQRNPSKDRVEIVVRNTMLGASLGDQHLGSLMLDKAAAIESAWRLELDDRVFRVWHEGEVVLDGRHRIDDPAAFMDVQGFFHARRNAGGRGAVVFDRFGIEVIAAEEQSERE